MEKTSKYYRLKIIVLAILTLFVGFEFFWIGNRLLDIKNEEKLNVVENTSYKEKNASPSLGINIGSVAKGTAKNVSAIIIQSGENISKVVGKVTGSMKSALQKNGVTGSIPSTSKREAASIEQQVQKLKEDDFSVYTSKTGEQFAVIKKGETSQNILKRLEEQSYLLPPSNPSEIASIKKAAMDALPEVKANLGEDQVLDGSLARAYWAQAEKITVKDASTNETIREIPVNDQMREVLDGGVHKIGNINRTDLSTLPVEVNATRMENEGKAGVVNLSDNIKNDLFRVDRQGDKALYNDTSAMSPSWKPKEFYEVALPNGDTIKTTSLPDSAVNRDLYTSLTDLPEEKSMGNKIAKISTNYFNDREAAKILGYTNEELSNLRNARFEDYLSSNSPESIKGKIDKILDEENANKYRFFPDLKENLSSLRNNSEFFSEKKAPNIDSEKLTQAQIASYLGLSELSDPSQSELQSLTQDGNNFTFDPESGRVTQTDENGKTKEIYKEWGVKGEGYNAEAAQAISSARGQDAQTSLNVPETQKPVELNWWEKNMPTWLGGTTPEEKSLNQNFPLSTKEINDKQNQSLQQEIKDYQNSLIDTVPPEHREFFKEYMQNNPGQPVTAPERPTNYVENFLASKGIDSPELTAAIKKYDAANDTSLKISSNSFLDSFKPETTGEKIITGMNVVPGVGLIAGMAAEPIITKIFDSTGNENIKEHRDKNSLEFQQLNHTNNELGNLKTQLLAHEIGKNPLSEEELSTLKNKIGTAQQEQGELIDKMRENPIGAGGYQGDWDALNKELASAEAEVSNDLVSSAPGESPLEESTSYTSGEEFPGSKTTAVDATSDSKIATDAEPIGTVGPKGTTVPLPNEPKDGNPFTQIKDIQTNPEAIQKDWEKINEEIESVTNKPENPKFETMGIGETKTETPSEISGPNQNQQAQSSSEEPSIISSPSSDGRPFQSPDSGYQSESQAIARSSAEETAKLGNRLAELQDYEDYLSKRIYGGEERNDIYGGQPNDGLMGEKIFFDLASRSGFDPLSGDKLDDYSIDFARRQAEMRENQLQDLKESLRSVRNEIREVSKQYEGQKREVDREELERQVTQNNLKTPKDPDYFENYGKAFKEGILEEVNRVSKLPLEEIGPEVGKYFSSRKDAAEKVSQADPEQTTASNEAVDTTSDALLNSKPEPKTDNESLQKSWEEINREMEEYQLDQDNPFNKIPSIEGDLKSVTNTAIEDERNKAIQNDWNEINKEIQQEERKESYQSDWDTLNREMEEYSATDTDSKDSPWPVAPAESGAGTSSPTTQGDNWTDEIENSQSNNPLTKINNISADLESVWENKPDAFNPNEWIHLVEQENNTGEKTGSPFDSGSTDFFLDPQSSGSTPSTPEGQGEGYVTNGGNVSPSIPNLDSKMSEGEKEAWKSYLLKEEEEMRRVEEELKKSHGKGDLPGATPENDNINANDNSNNKNTNENSSGEEEEEEETNDNED